MRPTEPKKPTVRIGDPLADGIRQPDPIILPEPAALFARRAARLEALSDDHPMAAWLRFIAGLAAMQDRAYRGLPRPAPVSPEAVERAVAARLPPLAAQEHRRDPAWRAALCAIVGEAANDPALPAEAASAAARLAVRDDAAVEALARDCLRGAVASGQAGEAVYAVAALQVYFAASAAALPADALRLLPQRSRCPVCGSAAFAGMVAAAGKAPGARYLHCGICATAWNHARAVCVNCGDARGLALRQSEGGNGAVKAETCDACHTYSKLFYQSEDMAIDPLADDLASLGLDLLVSDAGWSRATPNPFVIADGSPA